MYILFVVYLTVHIKDPECLFGPQVKIITTSPNSYEGLPALKLVF